MTVATQMRIFADEDEREIARPRIQYSLPQWSEAKRFITQGPLVGASGVPVRWSNETFPLQVGIMEVIDSGEWSRIMVIGPPQAGGKTDCAAINPILKAIEHDRKDALYMSANALKAHDQWKKKFEPAILASDDLAVLMPDSRDDVGTKDRRDFSNGCSLFMVGAESIANLSGSTIPVVVCDDVQAMPASLGVLGHPVNVAFTRSAALSEDDRTHVMMGTAGTVEDYLWKTWLKSSQFRPYVPCLGCGTYQLLEWDRMQFDASDSVAAHADCWMQCIKEGCRHEIRDEELPKMLRRFRWGAGGADGQQEGPRDR